MINHYHLEQKGFIKDENRIWKIKDNSIYYEKGYKNYARLQELSFWFQHRNNIIASVITRFPFKEELIDIGSGEGLITNFLSRTFGKKILSVEPRYEAAVTAKKRNSSEIICSFLEEISLEENSVSAFGMFDVLEHIKNDKKYLEYLYAKLIPGGRVYLTVPAYPFLWSDDDDYYLHYRRYTLRTLEESMMQCGFNIKFSSYFFSYLTIPIFLFRRVSYAIRGKNQSYDGDNRAEKDLVIKNKILHFLIGKMNKYELKRIQHATLPFGSSIIVVGEK